MISVSMQEMDASLPKDALPSSTPLNGWLSGYLKWLHLHSHIYPLCAIFSSALQAWDLTAGAASGVAAVLVSMPFDCIKTYMQVRLCVMPQGLEVCV